MSKAGVQKETNVWIIKKDKQTMLNMTPKIGKIKINKIITNADKRGKPLKH